MDVLDYLGTLIELEDVSQVLEIVLVGRPSLLQSLRRSGLKNTELADAQCQTIRLKLLKIGAQIQVTVRRIWFRMAGGYPYPDVFAQVYANLQTIPLRY